MNQQEDDSVQYTNLTTARLETAPAGRSTSSRSVRPVLSLVCGLFLLFAGSHLQAQPGIAKKSAKPKKADPKDKARKKIVIPASERLPSMNIKKPLITKVRFDQLTKKMKKVRINTVLARGNNNANSRQLIKEWAEWRILGMTRPDQQGDLFKTRTKISTELNRAAVLLKGVPKAPFRTIVCQEITKNCNKVLNNNYFVRLHSIIILGNLNLLEFNPVAVPKSLPTAYGPACEPLLIVLKDSKQPVSLKIAAVAGLKRIALLAQDDRPRNRRLAAALVEQFESKKLHSWYQRRLAEALGSVDSQKNLDGKAVIIQALAEAVVDNAGTRTVPVQSEAAKALGRAALAPDINIDLLMYEIVQLSRDMALKYNAELAKGGRLAPHWATSFFQVYLAFYARDRLERDFLFKRRRAAKDRIPGFLEKLPRSAAVKGAYAQIKPLVKHVLLQSRKAKKAPVNAATLAGIKTWLNTNRPKNFRVQSGLPPLRVMKAALAKPKTESRVGSVGGP